MPYKCRHTIVYLMTWKPTFETDEGNQREVVSAEYWSRRRDLNPRPADYESAALPLSYTGIRQHPTLLTRHTRCPPPRLLPFCYHSRYSEPPPAGQSSLYHRAESSAHSVGA